MRPTTKLSASIEKERNKGKFTIKDTDLGRAVINSDEPDIYYIEGSAWKNKMPHSRQIVRTMIVAMVQKRAPLDSRGSWAAYIAATPIDMPQHEAMVYTAQKGAKLPYFDARHYFPNLEHEFDGVKGYNK